MSKQRHRTQVTLYVTEEQKEQLMQLAEQANLTMSTYLVKKGLEQPIKSSRPAAELASIACQLYKWADTLEITVQRNEAKAFGGKIYEVLASWPT